MGNKFYWLLRRECRDKLTLSHRTDEYSFLNYSVPCDSVFHYTYKNEVEDKTLFTTMEFLDLCIKFKLKRKDYIKIDENGVLLNE